MPTLTMAVALMTKVTHCFLGALMIPPSTMTLLPTLMMAVVCLLSRAALILLLSTMIPLPTLTMAVARL